MIDRLGKCPHCGQSWKGSDIAEHLTTMDVFYSKGIDQVQEIARQNFGWDKNAPADFSIVISHEINGDLLYQCPNYKCGHVFDVNTEKEWNNLLDYRIKGFIATHLPIRIPEEEILNTDYGNSIDEPEEE